MLKIFLVEDEVVMREGIKNNIDWEKEGFIFAGEASDGELAFPFIQKIKPDIIITDIKMPFMDGLALSRLVKAEQPDVKIIILSGYDEFEYAKEAISIGITDYLVKPVSREKLLEAVRQVAQVITEEQEQRLFLETFLKERSENEQLERQRLFNDLISNQLSVSELLDKGRKQGLDLAAEHYNVVMMKLFPGQEGAEAYSADMVEVMEKIGEIAQAETEVILFERGIEGIAILIKASEEGSTAFAAKEFLEKVIKVLEGYPGLSYFAGIGMEVSRLREIHKAYDEASRAFACRYFMGEKKIIDSGELSDMKMVFHDGINLASLNIGKLDRKIVEKFLGSGSKSEIRHFVDEFLLSVGETNIDSLLFRQYIVVDIYLTVAAFVEKLGYESNTLTEKCGDLNHISSVFVNVQTMKDYLYNILDEAVKLRDMASMRKYSNLLDRAKAYIEENYDKEDISLNSVAASVNMSPNHFSTIFSQEMGETFIEYLTSVRMSRAKELLRCSSMKTSEIGYKVGYKDSHYFSYIFKKTQDCTPREFRTKAQNT